MIIQKQCDKINFSSNTNEVIRPVLNFFFMIRCHKYQKARKSTKKHQKALKSIEKHLSGKT